MLVTVATILAACSFVPGIQGDATAPLLISGRVMDGPRSVPEAQLLLDALAVEANPGDRAPYSQTFEPNADGTFELHLALTPELRALAAANGGFINFRLTGIWGADEAPVIAVFGFPREVAADAWADEAPTIELRPIGQTPNVDPGVPVPLPAET